MKAEAKKSRQDKAKVIHRMDLTFVDRRKLVKEGSPVSKMAEIYPCLLNEDEVGFGCFLFHNSKHI